ncbi:MAG: CcmD family protein [Chitinophagaceae bacterium]|nr:CcmD family protein [Chitinophagaceae bacterium]MCW5927710.1 CcmD family protein [Chitinophagaceae bacterium]
MRKFIVRFAFCFFFVITSLVLPAQQEVEMADTMRSNGKIYVVVAVLLVLFTGLFIYLIRIDRKISRLEKENKQ